MVGPVSFEFLTVDAPPSLLAEALPHCSGVFRIFDTHGNLILLDKTHDIARRVGGFYSETGEPKALDLGDITGHIDYCRTDSPLETLYLLYSQRRLWFPDTFQQMRTFPRFHLLKVNTRQRFPRIYATREIKQGVRYFGPFPSRSQLDRLRSTLERTFRIRPCRYNIRGDDPYPDCLYFQMHTCSRPCNGDINRESYLEDIEGAIAFIEGREERVIERLMDRIHVHAEHTQFEDAARLRRQVERVRRSRTEHQDTYFDLWGFDYLVVMKSDSVRKRKIAIVRSGLILAFEDHGIDNIEATVAAVINKHDAGTGADKGAERRYDEFCLVSSFLLRPVKSVRLFPLGQPGSVAKKIASEFQPPC